MPRGWTIQRSLAVTFVGMILSIAVALIGARVDVGMQYVGRSRLAACYRSLLWTRFESDSIVDVVDLASRLNSLPNLPYRTTEAHPHAFANFSFPGPDGHVELVHSGWPWRSLAGWRAEVTRAPGLIDEVIHKLAHENLPPPRSMWQWQSVVMMSPSSSVLCDLPFRQSAPTFIPYAPRWWPLIGNALVFTLLLALAIEAITFTRQRYRLRRGVCPHCRYDLQHTPPNSPCPECGTPFFSSRSSATNDKLSTPDASPPQ